MITVSTDFKNAMKAPTKELKAYVTDGVTQVNEDDDLKSLKIVAESSLLRTVLRKAYAEYFGGHDYLNKNVNIGIGVVLPSTSTEYIDYGTFRVVKKEDVKETESIKIEMYDKMHDALIAWDLDPIYEITYPATLLELLQAICTRLGWTLATTTFPNYTKTISSDVFTGVVKTYRDVLDMIAEASASIIFFNNDDELVVRQISHSSIDETMSGNDVLNSMMVESVWGGVDSVVLARTPQEDNIAMLENEVTNGTMEADSNWSSFGTPTTQERSNTQAYEGTYSRKFIVDAINEGIQSDTLSITNARDYRLSFWVYTTTISVGVKVRKGDNSGYEIDQEVTTGIVAGQWNYVELTFTSSATGSSGRVIVESGSNSSGTFYVDDVRLYDLTKDRVEIKIQNNLIMDSDRESWVVAIFNELYGLDFYPFKINSNGLGYIVIGDRLTVTDINSNSYEVVVFGVELLLSGGLKETLWAETPDKSGTKYQYAGILGQKITETEIIVNKQEGEIQLINSNLQDNYYTASEITLMTDSIISSVQNVSSVANNAQSTADLNSSDIETLQSEVSTLEQRADSIEIAIGGIGGTNLLKNSVGLKGDIKEWQILDGNGNPVNADNDGAIDQSSDVQVHGESGSAIRLDEQYIEQTFPTISGETYTFYCRYKSLLSTTLSITGISNITISAESEWSVFKTQFVATGSSTTIRISNVSSGAGAYIILTDMITKLGDASGWVQAPNEVYGQNYRFDKDGFEITSLTDTFKSILDNSKLAVYDTAGGSDKIVMLVSKDSGKITKLTAQDEFVLQRYENSASSVRIIPTDTGAMVVVNDA